MMSENGNVVTAVVPVRKENTRLVDKNTLPFGESNLLLHKLRQLKEVKCIDRIVVSSEDEDILSMAEKAGVQALKRPQEYADRSNPFGRFVEYICNQINGQHVLWACVTAPFVESDMYEEAITTYFEKLDEGYDSLISVLRLKRFILDENGAVNFRRGLQHKNSEELPNLYLYTNGIVLAPRAKMIEWKYNWGYIPYRYEVDKKAGIDISDFYDYHVACLLEGENK